MKPKLSIIVAIAENWAIGKNNNLLCHIPGDLKRFREITLGHCVIMGKRTWESLPNRPLPGRKNIVLTDQAGEVFPGAVMAYSIEEVMEKADPVGENFVIGGGTIYQQFLPLADKLYLTRVHKAFEADAFFPVVHFEEWMMLSSEHHSEALATAGFEFTHEIYCRKVD